MGKQSDGPDADFIESKRRQLTQLRDSLQRAANGATAEEGQAARDSNLQAREYEDDAQRLDTLEKQGILVSRAVDRLAQVARALAKIAEGTYGFSDVSGQRIADDRLEAVPEAVTTLDEQAASEKR
jgi:DnaK suppressor protein